MNWDDINKENHPEGWSNFAEVFFNRYFSLKSSQKTEIH